MFALTRLPQRNIMIRTVPAPVPKRAPTPAAPRSAPSRYISMKVLMLTQVKSCRACGRK